MFRKLIDDEIERVKAASQAGMLGKKVYERFEGALNSVADEVTESTVTSFISAELKDGNPFAMIPGLVTKEERERAVSAIERKIADGIIVLPEPLTEILALRLSNMTNAFLEMLDRISMNRKAVCDHLTGGRQYTKLEDIELSAGDTHNHGRSVMILTTDAGKLVYKPHDMRGDRCIYELADRFFPGFVGIPKCIAFGDSFGVCEFIGKERFEGEVNARAFWYNMGGMCAFLKMLGSTDMHIENVTCHGGRPYIHDLETVLSPKIQNDDVKVRYPELETIASRSLYLSAILPGSSRGKEYSVLLNIDDEGCAPVVNGRIVSVKGYFESFQKGFHEAYEGVVKNKEEIAGVIKSFPGDIPVRLLLRNTQAYADTMRRMYHRTSLASKESYEEAVEILSAMLKQNRRLEHDKVAESELKQLLRGDVPYVYTHADSRSLFSDSEEVATDVFEFSAIEHALDNLYAMGAKDELFDMKLIERSLAQYPMKLPVEDIIIKSGPKRADKPLSKEKALGEALRLLEELYSLHIPSPAGKPLWGYIAEEGGHFRFCDDGLSNGLSGIALFSAACASVSGDEHVNVISEKIIDLTLLDMQRVSEYVREHDFSFDHSPTLGEADGTAGMIKTLSLLKKYAPDRKYDELESFVFELLEKKDYRRNGASDRLIGMAGLVSALCRFARYRERKDIIKKAADSLLAMKTLEYNGKKLFKTIPDISRPISGAGHGSAGVAEALFAASKVLGDEKYAEAAFEALEFELEIYEKYQGKFGTWADLRSYPPEGYMHGYCSGAPGIGIMIERIRKLEIDNELTKKLFEYARRAVDELPLNVRDHLCCGNSAIAEYYISVGDLDMAGRVLGGMYIRCRKEGNYRYMAYELNNSITPSMFYGVSGVGYEMLRYAYPDKILSVL